MKKEGEKEKKYRISEVAEKMGLSPSAIRFYEKKGLFKPEKDAENGYRYYGSKDIKKIWSIVYHRNIDMSLETISNLKHTENLGDIREIVRRQKKEAFAKIVEEQKKLKVWDFYEETLDIVMAELNRFTVTEYKPLHLFSSDFLYRPQSTVFSVGHPITLFGADGTQEGYAVVHDDFIKLLDGQDLAAEERIVESFPCLYTIVDWDGDFEEEALLQAVIKKAKKNNFVVKPPYYVIYLLSSGEWESTKRYYEVFLTLA